MASVLELILRSRKEGDAAKKTKKEIDDLTKASGAAGKAAKRLSLGMLAVKGAMITAGLAILKSIPAMLEQGVEIGRAETALIAYAGSAEEATRTIELMKDATGGAMSRMAAMQNATRMLSMGLASNADEAAKLTKIAITLGSTMGKGPQAAIEDFTLMLANQSILRLDTFGISGANVRARMQELADQGFAPADRQLRFLTATMEMAEGKMRALDEAGFEATSNVDRLKASIEDMKAETITWLADGLMPWIDGLYALRDAQLEHEEEIIRSTTSYQDYVDEMLRIGAAKSQYGVIIGAATEAEWEHAQKVAATTSAMDGMTSAMGRYAIIADTAATSTGGLTTANQALVTSLSALGDAEIAKTLLGELNQQYEDGLITSDEYTSGMETVMGTFTDLTDEQIAARIEFANFTQSIEDGDPALATMVTRLGEITGYYQGLPARKTSHIYIVEHISRVYEAYDQLKGRRRQLGGPVSAGVPYLVGERGPEMFVPNQSGRIEQNTYDQRQTNIGPFTNNFNNETDEWVFLDKFKRAIARI